jgi:hypothetical protein
MADNEAAPIEPGSMAELDAHIAALAKAVATSNQPLISAAALPLLCGAVRDWRRIADALETIAANSAPQIVTVEKPDEREFIGMKA